MNKIDAPPRFFSDRVSRARVFYHDRDGGEDSRVVGGGCEHCAADYEMRRRDFPYYCLELLAGGRGSVSFAGGPERRLQPGSVFVYGPRLPHRITGDPASPPVKYFVDFTGRRALAMLRKFDLSPGSVTQIFPPRRATETFETLIAAGLESSPRTERRLALLLELLLIDCAEGRIASGAADTRAFATYTRCLHRVETQPTGSLTPGTLAAQCHIDNAYLSRLFRRFAGCTPGQYLMRARLNLATRRLAEPGKLVKEVADEFGFADPYHFSRSFKRFHGISPDEFIKKRRR